jgi:Zn-dependent peptidase ImmA (M78 family)
MPFQPKPDPKQIHPAPLQNQSPNQDQSSINQRPVAGMPPGEIIKKFTQAPPVDVKGLAEALGLKVWEENLGADVSGIIEFNPAKGGDSGYSIAVNSSDSFFRKRFTVAHEIAHFLLHRDKLTKLFKEDRMYRGLINGQREEEANRLAADILMPRQLVRDLLEQGIKTPEGMAAKLQVSVPAMEVRLGIYKRPTKE